MIEPPARTCIGERAICLEHCPFNFLHCVCIIIVIVVIIDTVHRHGRSGMDGMIRYVLKDRQSYGR